MPLTKASFAVINVAGTITSTTVGNSSSIPSITFDQNGVISAVSNTTLSVPANTTITTPTISGNLSFDSTRTSGIRLPSANTLTFHTSGTEDMRIDANGNVGLGTTTPAAKIAIFGGTNQRGQINFGNTAEDGATPLLGSLNNESPAAAVFGWGLYDSNSTGNLVLYRRNDSTTGVKTAEWNRGNGNFSFDSGYGTAAVAYGCRAWVNFNGTGTPAIRSSGNVSSLTDNGTGDYTINFATGLVDNNYACVFSGMRDSDGNGSLNTTALKSGSYGNTVSTGSVRVLSENDSGTRVDVQMYTAAFFR